MQRSRTGRTITGPPGTTGRLNRLATGLQLPPSDETLTGLARRVDRARAWIELGVQVVEGVDYHPMPWRCR